MQTLIHLHIRIVIPKAMKKLFLIILLFPLVCFSQKKQGVLGFAMSFDFPDKGLGEGIGVHFNGNGEIANGFYLGLSAGVIKFKNLSKAYVPVAARFTVMPGYRSRKTYPVILFEPGYGFYKHGRRGFGEDLKGGFTMVIAGGVGFTTRSRVSPFITLGYSQFSFEGFEQSTYDGLAIRTGIHF